MISVDDYLDPQGELPPPWAQFPRYERHCLGWRMGVGESYLGWWWEFLHASIPLDQRLAYLHRHGKAPYSWWSVVDGALGNEASEGDSQEVRAFNALLALDLLDTDAAYRHYTGYYDPTASTPKNRPNTFLPWKDHESPEAVARYDIRTLWFFCREQNTRRANGERLLIPGPEALPAWATATDIIERAEVPKTATNEGLRGLAWMLLAGDFKGPWALGFSPADDDDSFEMDMNPVDAFRLWLFSVFDDKPHLGQVMTTLEMPPGPWTSWVENNHFLDF